MWNHIKFIQKIKSLLPFNIKIMLIRFLVFLQQLYYRLYPQDINNVSSSKKVIYLLLSTDYSNLGDHAMTYAQKKLLRERFPDSQIVELLVSDTLKYLTSIRKNIKRGDVITLKGGGNIGLEYFREELYRRIIVKHFTDNRIIIFPQTAYFPNTKLGRRESKNTENIFLNNPNLYLFTRDIPSYNQFKDQLGERVMLTPDIVLSLKNIESDKIRNGAMICMRNDVEGKYSLEERREIRDLLENYYEKVLISDTTTDYPIPINIREKELKKIWDLFMSVEIVITDRLHGMIFAALTKTPCIVFNTYNHKLVGQYEWLKHLDYIKFLEYNRENVKFNIEKIKSKKFDINNRNCFDEYYENIVELI
jgi:pyruvyl transferase EpsI